MLNSWCDTWARINLQSLSDRNLPNLPGLIALRGSDGKIYFLSYLANLTDIEKLSCQFGNPLDVLRVFDPEASILYWALPQYLTEILGIELTDFVSRVSGNLPLKKQAVTGRLLSPGVSVDSIDDSHSELLLQ